MTQVLPRYCPRCGAPIVTSSGACAACGLAIPKKGEQHSPYPYTQNRRKMGKRELMILLVVLLFTLGATVYAFAGFLGVALPGFVITQPSITTTSINSFVPYAGVDIT